MMLDSDAHSKFRRGRTLEVVGTVVSSVGGFFIGQAIGSAMFGNQHDTKSLAIGAGVTLVGITFYSTGYKQIKSGMEIYNRSDLGLGRVDPRDYEVKIQTTLSGLGLTISY